MCPLPPCGGTGLLRTIPTGGMPNGLTAGKPLRNVFNLTEDDVTSRGAARQGFSGTAHRFVPMARPKLQAMTRPSRAPTNTGVLFCYTSGGLSVIQQNQSSSE